MKTKEGCTRKLTQSSHKHNVDVKYSEMCFSLLKGSAFEGFLGFSLFRVPTTRDDVIDLKGLITRSLRKRERERNSGKV